MQRYGVDMDRNGWAWMDMDGHGRMSVVSTRQSPRSLASLAVVSAERRPDVRKGEEHPGASRSRRISLFVANLLLEDFRFLFATKCIQDDRRDLVKVEIHH